jgi:hypothetical protein
MARNILVLRRFLLPLFLFVFWGCAYAGADPTPTDWLPRFYKIALDGSDVVIDSKITQIRLHNGQWENTSSSPINMLVQKQTDYFPRTESCSVPKEVLHRYENEYGHISIVSCDLPERIWFASGGYCGEGDDDPLYNQGQLYSFSPANGKVQEYRGFLPKCAEVAGMARINNKLVLATVYQGEYSLGPGKVLLFNLDDVKAHPKTLTNPHPTGAALAMSAYDSQCDCLWFATEEGVERLKESNGKWEQRYLDYEITPDNKFVLTLSSKKPSDDKMWLGRLLYSYPIEDLRGFLTAWNKSPASQYNRPRVGPLLLPFYIAALERTNEGWEDWSFAGLMNIIAAHQYNENQEVIRALMEKLLKQPMNLSRRQEVISKAETFGVGNAKELEDAYIDALLKDYFFRARANGTNVNDAVQISFEHQEYLPKLRDYYLTHTITFDVEKHFLDRVNQYNAWPGYEIMAEAVEQGRKRYEYRQGLLRKCTEIRPPFSDDKLLPILQARLETDAQAKFMNDLSLNGSDSCINVSRFWFYGDEPTIRAKVALMLDTAANHKEFSSVVLDILNNKFSTHFQNIDEWKRWWTFDNAKDDCSKEMTVCRFWQGSCVSMGAPQGTSTCDMDCRAQVLGKLNAVGITASTHARSPASPLDCVGFRIDLGGTEAGAKCLAKLLGFEYHAVGCNEDGYPFNVRVH